MGRSAGGFWQRVFSTSVLYGSLALFISVLHNVFLLYYVETFVSVYKIDKVSFWVGETVFLIWNSVNDPLFGWLSDRAFLGSTQPGSAPSLSSPPPSAVVLQRVSSLCTSGPLLALSFLSFWGCWARPALQFPVCLCLYDGFLTAADLQHSALMSDLALSAARRARLSFHCSVAGALGSASVFLSYAFWDKRDMRAFRLFCAALAAFSALGFLLAARALRTRFQEDKEQEEDGARPKREEQAAALKELSAIVPPPPEKPVTVGQYVKQLSKHRNFMWFVSMNLIQVFHCHFNSNFFPLFLEHLLSDHISASTGSLLLGVSYIAPHLNNLYFLTLCRRYGVYHIIRWLFMLKLGLSVAMLLAGADHIYLLCIFIASNRVFTEGTCKLLKLVISDLVDEDYVVNRRRQAASALLFGMVALLTKPGQTLAPLIGTWLLCVYTGYDIFDRSPPLTDPAVAPPLGPLAPPLGPLAPPIGPVAPPLGSVTPPLRLGCFHMLVLVPIFCSLLQLVAWSRFTLHGRRLQGVKAQREGAQQHGHLVDVKAI